MNNRRRARTPTSSRADLADQLRLRLLRVARALRREAKALPVSSAQSSILSFLLLGEPMRVTDLAKAEGVAVPTMTQLVQRMVEAGWIVRDAPAGTYNNFVNITEAGRDVAAQVAAARNRTLVDRLQGLSEEECALLGQMLPLIDKMYGRMPWREAEGLARDAEPPADDHGNERAAPRKPRPKRAGPR